MKGFEKSVYDLKMKCKERTMKANELQGRLEQKEKDLEELREQLEEKRRECEGNGENIQGLVWQIREIKREMDAKQAYANN